MRIAYLVVAHDSPGHLRRLIPALSSPSSACFVHIDRKARLGAFLPIPGAHVSMDRIAVHWADFSVVEAVFVLLRRALEDPRRFDRFVLLSGRDYPLHPAHSIEAFFSSHTEREFIELVPMPSSEADGKPISRLTQYKLRPQYKGVGRLARRLLMRTGTLPRRRDYRDYLGRLSPFGGSTWWALTREASTHLVHFHDNELRAAGFFRNTHCPDESYFHTILGGTPFAARASGSLTYADWRAGRANPEMLGADHLERFKSQDFLAGTRRGGPGTFLFARKFSDDTAAVVDAIDCMRRDREEQGLLLAV